MRADVLVDLTPLDTTSRYRGIGNYVRALGRALAALSFDDRRGLTIAALTALGGDGAEGSLTWSGSPSEPQEDGEVPWRWRRRTLLVPTLRRLRPRLFHATQPIGTPRGSFVPRVVTCHDLLRLALHRDYLPGPGQRHAYRAIEAARYFGARRIIAVSEHTASDLVRLLRVPSARIDVVPHGVDHERFRPPQRDEERSAAARARRALGIGARPYLVYVGGGDPRKSLDVLVDAFARAGCRDLELVIVGRLSPSEEQRFLAALRAAGDPEGVRPLGFVPDDAIPAVLAGARALVFPSTYEGFGLPVLEAMAAGCPVIATKATSVAEVIGDAGLHVPPRDARALSQAIRAVAADESLRADLARAGIARARTFTWHRAALGTVESYVRALA